ncbi:MAG: Crp/Fnr family transcriptional regulator [Halanaerobiaceae bacterium]
MRKAEKCLQDLAIFSRLDEKNIKLICQRANERQYNTGEIVFFEKDEVKKIYLLASGRVKLSMLSPEGKEKVLTILQEGDIFGEVSVFAEDPQPMTAEVVEDARLLILAWDELEEIIGRDPSIAIKIIDALSRKTRLLTTQIRELVFQDAAGRLASLLLRFLDDFGHSINGGEIIDIVLTHQEIANLIGTSRVTVTKLMNEFMDEGIIKKYRRKIVVKDRARLEKKREEN